MRRRLALLIVPVALEVALAVALAASRAHAETAFGPSPLPVEASTSSTSSTSSTLTTTINPGAEVFAQYSYTSVSDAPSGGSTWDHSFDVPRAWLGVGVERGIVHGRVLAEGVRSSGDSSLIGVSGDSIVFRAREAWLGAHPVPWIDVRAGIIPTALAPFLDDAWRLRVLGASAAESSGFTSPADLGAQIRAAIPGNYGTVMLGVYNGDGYTQRDLNRGKNTEASLFLHLPDGVAAPLTIALVETIGSEGAGSTKANRSSFGLHWLGDRVRAGAMATLAQGVDGDPTKTGWAIEASARIEPVDHLLFALRFSDTITDTSTSGANVIAFTGAVGWRFDDPLETWLAFVKNSPGSASEVANPGTDTWELRAAARVAF